MRSASESFWRMIRLAVTVALMSACRASEYEYLGWKQDMYNGGRSYGKPPLCVDIPDDLRLCHNVGYNQMLLPNLLEHETMAEVKQQASSWVPLVHKNCHPGTQVFLCSLFAPVCLDRPIYPCRWLCEAVRDGCTPIMEAFGFPWPEMLTCDKFPQDDVCIAMTQPNSTEATMPTGYSPICPPCDNEMKTDAMLEHMCASEFGLNPQGTDLLWNATNVAVISVRHISGLQRDYIRHSALTAVSQGHPCLTNTTTDLRFGPPECDSCSVSEGELEETERLEAVRAKIKEVKRENNDRKVILQKKKKMLKPGNLKKKDMKTLVLYLKNGADCPCQQLDNLGNQYLIMGRKVDKQYLLTGIHKWDKQSKEFKKAIKKLKTYKCPAFENVFK
ncbi:Secreted frizzled-related protein 1 [Collichthys lucidus]|uniref:Secreted frizzled-related protein 1 n=1 Tax=Collichthys lucidus TaxID=240159 RepID=A0A4U5UWH8_COLLU|nr:Secreted frizzled-related protein 1 [Collichthys lucidus]